MFWGNMKGFLTIALLLIIFSGLSCATTTILPPTPIIPTPAPAVSSTPTIMLPTPTIAVPTPAIAVPTPTITLPSPTLKQPYSSEENAAIKEATKRLEKAISNALWCMEDSLPKNPNLTELMTARISLLKNPDLYNNIISNDFFVVDFVSSVNKRQIPIVAAFPIANMRNEASDAVQIIKKSLPVLEGFMANPFPIDRFFIWYGFSIGNSGGGGEITMEDKTTYQARWKQPMMPYEPILCHELSHSYIGHEGLNQFLEIYTYNMIKVNSVSFKDWTYLRDYKTWQGTKTGYAALLDVYQLIGLDPMKNAYRTIYQIKPAYGQPLSSTCKQAFVDQAPSNLKSQLANIVANITY